MNVKIQDICSKEINLYWKIQFMEYDINGKD